MEGLSTEQERNAREMESEISFTCANFDGENVSLEETQKRKLKNHADRLDLDGSQSLLDCGFGSGCLSNHLSDSVNEYTGLTVSIEQALYAKENDKSKRKSTEFIVNDWSQHIGRYDRFTSICMLEHVGKNKLQNYFNWIDLSLKPGGIGTLQFISSDTPISPWADKYIFPGAYSLISMKRSG